MAKRVEINRRRAVVSCVLAFGAAVVGAPSLSFCMEMDSPQATRSAGSEMDRAYKPTLTPFVSRDTTPAGFGLFASSGHRTVNLAQPTSWSVNPDASTSGTAVGLGWRARNLSATMGYVRPSSASSSNEAFTGGDGVQRFRPRAMVGLGLAIRY